MKTPVIANKRMTYVRALKGSAPFFGILAMLLGGSAYAQQDIPEEPFERWKFSTGIDFSSGKYGATEDTEILYIPASVQYERENWRVKVTVPYISIKGPGGVIGGPDGPIVIGPGGAGGTSTESGLGDVVVRATYTFVPSTSDGAYFEVTGKVKIPTANENKGLGTGEADYFVQGDIFKTIGNLTPFATIGYRIAGDPAGFDLNNTFYGSLGLGYKLSPQTSIGAIVDYREKTSDLSEKRLEAVPYAVFKLGKSASLNLYGVVGFSDGSPDAGGGLQISLSY